MIVLIFVVVNTQLRIFSQQVLERVEGRGETERHTFIWLPPARAPTSARDGACNRKALANSRPFSTQSLSTEQNRLVLLHIKRRKHGINLYFIFC